MPLPGREELEVTCAFEISPHPVYLFAIRNSSQARFLAALSFLEFQRANVRFKGYVVHDDFEVRSQQRTGNELLGAADKQFVSLADFQENASSVLTRERAA